GPQATRRQGPRSGGGERDVDRQASEPPDAGDVPDRVPDHGAACGPGLPFVLGSVLGARGAVAEHRRAGAGGGGRDRRRAGPGAGAGGAAEGGGVEPFRGGGGGGGGGGAGGRAAVRG